MTAKHRWSVAIATTVFVVGLIITTAIVTSREPQHRATSMPEISTTPLRGISLSPKSFSAVDLTSFFGEAKDYGNTLSWAGSFQDLSPTSGAAVTVIAQSKKHNLTAVIITGPSVEQTQDNAYQTTMRQKVVEFVSKQKPAYLGIGNEIDGVYLDSPANYPSFAAFLSDLAANVRTVSPETKVFTVFQLERVKGLQGGLFGKNNDETNNLWSLVEQIQGFDLLAFTTYPGLIYKDPADIPADYYSETARHSAVPIAFSEIGWFRDGPSADWASSETEQAGFIERFAELTQSLAPKFVIWPFLHDQTAAPAPFTTMGLLAKTASSSEAATAWESYVASK